MHVEWLWGGTAVPWYVDDEPAGELVAVVFLPGADAMGRAGLTVAALVLTARGFELLTSGRPVVGNIPQCTVIDCRRLQRRRGLCAQHDADLDA